MKRESIKTLMEALVDVVSLGGFDNLRECEKVKLAKSLISIDEAKMDECDGTVCICIHSEEIDLTLFSTHQYYEVEEIGKRATDLQFDAPENIGEAIAILNELSSPVPLVILDTPILTAEGKFSLRTISYSEAKRLANEYAGNINSVVEHQSTAAILTKLLGREIPTCRQSFIQEPGQKALVFRLNKEPEKGKTLSNEDIETIGYSFQLLEMKRV